MPANAKARKPSRRARVLPKSALDDKAFPKLMNVDDAAAALSVSRTAVYRMMAEGTLSYLQIGKVRKISHHDIWVYLRRARRNVSSAAAPEPDAPALVAPNPKQPDLPYTQPAEAEHAQP